MSDSGSDDSDWGTDSDSSRLATGEISNDEESGSSSNGSESGSSSSRSATPDLSELQQNDDELDLPEYIIEVLLPFSLPPGTARAIDATGCRCFDIMCLSAQVFHPDEFIRLNRSNVYTRYEGPGPTLPAHLWPTVTLIVDGVLIRAHVHIMEKYSREIRILLDFQRKLQAPYHCGDLAWSPGRGGRDAWCALLQAIYGRRTHYTQDRMGASTGHGETLFRAMDLGRHYDVDARIITRLIESVVRYYKAVATWIGYTAVGEDGGEMLWLSFIRDVDRAQRYALTFDVSPAQSPNFFGYLILENMHPLRVFLLSHVFSDELAYRYVAAVQEVGLWTP